MNNIFGESISTATILIDPRFPISEDLQEYQLTRSLVSRRKLPSKLALEKAEDESIHALNVRSEEANTFPTSEEEQSKELAPLIFISFASPIRHLFKSFEMLESLRNDMREETELATKALWCLSKRLQWTPTAWFNERENISSSTNWDLMRDRFLSFIRPFSKESGIRPMEPNLPESNEDVIGQYRSAWNLLCD